MAKLIFNNDNITYNDDGSTADTNITFSTSELTISGDILPPVTEAYDIGSSSQKYDNVWAKEFNGSDSSITLGEGWKISATGGSISFKKVRDLNKLPPMITNFRDALVEYGILFLQKYEVTQVNKRSASKVVNYIKILIEPDASGGQYMDPARQIPGKPNVLIDILDEIVTNNPSRFTIGDDTHTTFKEVWDYASENSGSNNAWNTARGALESLVRGKTKQVQKNNNYDEIAFNLISLQNLERFMTNDVTNAINFKKKNDVSGGINTSMDTWQSGASNNAFSLDNGFNHQFRFKAGEGIEGHYNPETNAFETGEVQKFFGATAANFNDGGFIDFNTYDAAATGGIGAINLYDDASGASAISNIDVTKTKVTIDASNVVDLNSSITYNYNYELELVNTSSTSNFPERSIIAGTTWSGDEVTFKTEFPYYLGGGTIINTNIKYNVIPMQTFDMGMTAPTTANQDSSTMFGSIMTDWATLSGDLSGVTSTEDKKRVIISKWNFPPATTASDLSGRTIKIKKQAFISAGMVSVDIAGTGIEISSVESGGSTETYFVLYLNSDLTDEISITNNTSYNYEIISPTYANELAQDSGTTAVTYGATSSKEVYNDPTKMAGDSFTTFFLQHAPSSAIGSGNNNKWAAGSGGGGVASADTFGSYTSGVTTGGQLDTMMAKLSSTILDNIVPPEQFDASKLMAYNDEDYFIIYSMIPENTFGSYTNNNFHFGYTNEPYTEPYCKVTINGSSKATKMAVVSDSIYDNSSKMNTIKQNLDDGYIFTEGLYIGDSTSYISRTNNNGIICQGDIVTYGTLEADTLSANIITIPNSGSTTTTISGGGITTNSLNVGGFSINENGNGHATGSGDISVSGNVSASGATFTGRVTAQAVNFTSDRRLKDNIIPLTNQTLDNIKPVVFTWKGKERNVFGVIAQDVQEVYPELVSEVNDTLRVDYIQFIPLLIKEVQDLKNQNQTLVARIEELENK